MGSKGGNGLVRSIDPKIKFFHADMFFFFGEKKSILVPPIYSITGNNNNNNSSGTNATIYILNHMYISKHPLNSHVFNLMINSQ